MEDIIPTMNEQFMALLRGIDKPELIQMGASAYKLYQSAYSAIMAKPMETYVMPCLAKYMDIIVTENGDLDFNDVLMRCPSGRGSIVSIA